MRESLQQLQDWLKEKKLDGVIIPSEDFHQSEYVGDHFKTRAYFSGFTGSAGTLFVLPEEAHLWTDGRYFLQAEEQLKDSGVTLKKMGEPGVPTLTEFLAEVLPKGGKLAFDGRVISLGDGMSYEKIMKGKEGSVDYEVDPAKLWTSRPALSQEKAFFLKEEYSGEATASKIQRVRQEMAKEGAKGHLVASLDDINWLLNIRGNDILYSPMVLSYLYIGEENVDLFMDEAKLNDEIRQNFETIGLKLHPYDEVYEFVKGLEGSLLVDPAKVNYALVKNIPEEVTIIEKANPSQLMKACKNETELKNIRQAHIKDGIAWTKFMYWLKHQIGKETITEIQASDRLEAFRKEQSDYLYPSFAPISGYGPHGAIVHYEATPETQATLEPRGLYLSDTGSNFKQGSTDITRTLALGKATEEEKDHYTLVLKSHIDLAMAKFLKGAPGSCLDMLARKPFWDRGMNFNHGTGHGVGYLLSIHEGPAGIRYRVIPSKNEAAELKKGMVISNEPGLYISGKHGIRLENLIVVQEDSTTEFGEFYCFETITFVPFDLEAVDPTKLTQEEKDFLNAYHKEVFEKISPALNEEEVAWLKEATRAI